MDAIHADNQLRPGAHLLAMLVELDQCGARLDIKLTRFGKRQPVYLLGELARCVYIIRRGWVKVSRCTTDGRELTFALLGPGELLGEMEIFNGTRREDQAITLAACELHTIIGRQFTDLIKIHPILSSQLTHLMAARIRRFEQQLHSLASHSVPSRLASVILQLAEDHENRQTAFVHLPCVVTHHDLATLVASTRETVSATLGAFRRKRLIDFDRRGLRILNRAGLTAIT